MIQQVDHIDLKVPNLQKHIEFFTALGFEMVRQTDPERGSVEMALPGANQVVFEVREDASLTETVLGHIALSSTSADEDLILLKDQNIPVLKSNHFIAGSGRSISNFADPTGMVWQLSHSGKEELQ